MNSIALNISNLPIRQDSEGRYNLNDLHKAAGSENKHRPSIWLKNQQTVDLITEIEKAGISAIQSKQQVGTFAVKDLVYAYAMWISPAFTLKVIHAYDSLVSVKYGLKEIPSPYISSAEAAQFKKSLESHCGSNRKRYSDLYRKVWEYYGIDSYKNIPAGKLEESARLCGMRLLKLVKSKIPEETPLLTITQDQLDELVNDKAKVLTGESLPTYSPRVKLLVTIEDGITQEALVPFGCCIVDPKDAVNVKTFIQEYVGMDMIPVVTNAVFAKMNIHLDSTIND